MVSESIIPRLEGFSPILKKVVIDNRAIKIAERGERSDVRVRLSCAPLIANPSQNEYDLAKRVKAASELAGNLRDAGAK